MSDSTSEATTVEEPDEATIRRAVAGAAMGNAVEWFDYAIYAYLGTAIGLNFFPDFSAGAQQLFVFAGVAIPFVVRPLGGIILGPLGDKFGRRSVLSATILLMSAATFVIGLIPSYESIGFAAPLLLLLARLVQGFSTGGEYGGAATFIAEYAPTRRRGFFGSFLEFGTLFGTALGAALATVIQLSLPADAVNTWGWRIPFIIAAFLGMAGFYLRSRLEDTPAFRALEARSDTTSTPFVEVLRNTWPQILNLIGFVILLNVANYTILTYLQSYLRDVLQIEDSEALLVLIAVMVVMMAVIGPVGSLSDRVGRRPMLLTSAIGFLVLSWPAFYLIGLRDYLPVAVGVGILGLLLVLMLGTIGSTLPAMFPTRNRYGGFSIGYSVSTAAFGGTAPLVITALVQSTGNNYVPAFYMMAAALIAVVPILLMPETAGKPIDHPTRIPGTEPVTTGA